MSVLNFVKEILLGPSYQREARRAFEESASWGLQVSQIQMEGHALAGGHPLAVVRALKRAGDLRLDVSWQMACAMDLVGRDVEAAVDESLVESEIVFDSIQDGTGSQMIEGNCRDGSPVRIVCRLRYRNGFRIAPWKDRDLAIVQDSIALRALLAVGQAESLQALQVGTIGTELSLWARGEMCDILHVEVAFSRPSASI